jgi:hypothetical protein
VQNPRRAYAGGLAKSGVRAADAGGPARPPLPRGSTGAARTPPDGCLWAIGEFVVNNADYPNWDTFKKAMADHIQYRNGPHRDQRLLKAERRLLIAA